VNVNTPCRPALTANPTELHYRKIGDKVLTQDSSTLTWSTSNASTIMLDGMTVQPSGSDREAGSVEHRAGSGRASPLARSTKPRPTPPRNERLRRQRRRGWHGTQTASLHITGTVEPIPDCYAAEHLLSHGLSG
jgi:hypothetical protein